MCLDPSDAAAGHPSLRPGPARGVSGPNCGTTSPPSAASQTSSAPSASARSAAHCLLTRRLTSKTTSRPPGTAPDQLQSVIPSVGAQRPACGIAGGLSLTNRRRRTAFGFVHPACFGCMPMLRPTQAGIRVVTGIRVSHRDSFHSQARSAYFSSAGMILPCLRAFARPVCFAHPACFARPAC